MELQEFRQIFYFFQYQFYLRSERAAKKGLNSVAGEIGLLPRGPIGQFLFSLAEYPDETHYRWDPYDSRPKPKVRRKDVKRFSIREHNRQKNQPPPPDGHLPVRIGQLGQGQASLYRTRRISIRCRFMLFDFPKGMRKDQVASLYKSLILNDLVVILGHKPWNIAKDIIDKKVSDYVDTRGKMPWELLRGRWFERVPLLRVAIEQELSSNDSDEHESVEERYLKTVFTTIEDNSKYKKKQDSGEDSHTQIRKIHDEIQRYLRRAELLKKLAPIGRFSNYPAELKTL